MSFHVAFLIMGNTTHLHNSVAYTTSRPSFQHPQWIKTRTPTFISERMRIWCKQVVNTNCHSTWPCSHLFLSVSHPRSSLQHHILQQLWPTTRVLIYWRYIRNHWFYSCAVLGRITIDFFDWIWYISAVSIPERQCLWLPISAASSVFDSIFGDSKHSSRKVYLEEI